MKRREDRLFLRDMLAAVQKIEAYLDGVSYAAFRGDGMRQMR